MNIYDSILSFHGTWRTYQARVLEAIQSYLEDKKIHIVAAPGAGKTTLGIELIRRGGQPCLILSPRIVIRQQWLERIQTAFLKEGLIPEDYLSNNIQNPKLITSITYQTLFCGMTQYKGIEEEEDTQEQEEVDNKEMLKKSREREALFQQWQKAVFLYETMETTEECSMNKEPLKTGSFFFYAMGYLVFLILVEILNIATHVRFNSGNFFNDLFFYLLSCLTGVATLYLGMELMKRRSPLKRLQNLGKAVLHALEQKGEITSARRVEVAEDHGIFPGCLSDWRNSQGKTRLCRLSGRDAGTGRQSAVSFMRKKRPFVHERVLLCPHTVFFQKRRCSALSKSCCLSNRCLPAYLYQKCRGQKNLITCQSKSLCKPQ